MTYEIIQPPFTLKFSEMPKAELKEYFAWFQGVLPQRLDQLAMTVKETAGLETWRADFTPSSLDALGEWFVTQVETRQRTQDEIQDIESQARPEHPLTIPDNDLANELSNRTFSLAMDVGMYLSQAFIKNHPNVRWDQPFGNKRFVDYGQPVLIGFSSAPLNPVRILVTLAYGVVRKTRTGKRLREIYEVWAKQVVKQTEGQ
jgi:hypothetical protein